MNNEIHNFLSAGEISTVTRDDILLAAKKIQPQYKKKKRERLQKIKDESKKQCIAEMKDIDFENVVLGDSLLTAKNCPSGIKLVMTDSPYGQNFVSNRRTASAKDEGILNDGDVPTATNLLAGVLQQLYPKMCPDSHVLAFTSHKYEPEFRDAIARVGLRYKSSLVWKKPNHGMGDLSGSFAPNHEVILHYVKGKPKVSPRIDDVLEGKKIIKGHSTAKPVDLLMRLINSCTIEGELVADPFAGHGSTAIACKRINRNFRVSEIDEFNHSQIKKNLLSCKK